MAKPEHLANLKRGVRAWNEWRVKLSFDRPDLSGAKLIKADLSGANLSWATLERADLSDADLIGADLSGARLGGGGPQQGACWIHKIR